MSAFWLWLILKLFFLSISINQARYIRLSSVNCSELSPIGTHITQLLDVLPSSNWEFTFLTRTSLISYFLLDNLKGTITVKRYLDREDLCRLNLCSCLNECLFKIEVNAISDAYTYILSLPILILDENDNYCFFFNEIYYLNISESVQIDTRITLPIAYDPDLTPNNIQSYFIFGKNYSDLFRLDNQLTPSLIIIKELDREFMEKYYFDLCASEGINEQKRSCCTKISLTITDINDNSAKFQDNQRLPVVVNVSEFSLIHSEVIQMKAFDPDEGINGEIRYTFSKWTLKDRTVKEIFNLNSKNGSITLLKQLDYEKRNNYELQIQAKDQGPNAIATYATVIVQVIDENDCIPEIFIFSPPDVQLINNSLIYISENISLNTSILYLTVSDHDTGENGHVSIELLISNSILQLKKLNSNTYILITNILFDREQISFYSFSLITYDHGKPRQSIINKFELHLIDINDCSPFFENFTNYSFTIDENNPENLILHTIQVFDLDENDHITLSLESNNKNLFELNQQNQLVIKQSLDYEKQSSYQFTLIAEDLVKHRTSIPIRIDINDLNDNPVRFLSNFTQFKIQENQVSRIFLGQIQAEDKDKSTQIIYTIHPDDLSYIRNRIELNSNGSLYTKRRLDQAIQFRAIANDSLHTDFILIQIHLDTKPILKTRSPFCYVLNTTESIQIQLEVNDNVSFSLINPLVTDPILLPNGSLIIKPVLRKYSLDIYLRNTSSNFILLIVKNQSECEKNLFNQEIILICLLCCIILICCYFYFQQRRCKKSFNDKTKLTPSFSSSLNEEIENDSLLLSTSSPQFTAMTIISSSIDQQTNKSSSLSNSSSSTYIKMSHSFEDEII